MATARKSSSKESPDLQELLVLELQEIHSAENQLARIIPRVVKSVEAQALRPMIEERMKEGEQIIQDVETALEELGATPGRKKNVAAEGLVEDMREHVQELETGPALDTALIAALQKTEHYCIAAWGTVKALGKAAQQQDLVAAMERALEEGREYDERLTQLAEEEITPQLMAQAEGGEQEEETADESEQGVEPAARGASRNRKSDGARQRT
jgi:ferritin-like metal-binding protein YciE